LEHLFLSTAKGIPYRGSYLSEAVKGALPKGSRIAGAIYQQLRREHCQRDPVLRSYLSEAVKGALPKGSRIAGTIYQKLRREHCQRDPVSRELFIRSCKGSTAKRISSGGNFFNYAHSVKCLPYGKLLILLFPAVASKYFVF